MWPLTSHSNVLCGLEARIIQMIESVIMPVQDQKGRSLLRRMPQTTQKFKCDAPPYFYDHNKMNVTMFDSTSMSSGPSGTATLRRSESLQWHRDYASTNIFQTVAYRLYQGKWCLFRRSSWLQGLEGLIQYNLPLVVLLTIPVGVYETNQNPTMRFSISCLVCLAAAPGES